MHLYGYNRCLQLCVCMSVFVCVCVIEALHGNFMGVDNANVKFHSSTFFGSAAAGSCVQEKQLHEPTVHHLLTTNVSRRTQW